MKAQKNKKYGPRIDLSDPEITDSEGRPLRSCFKQNSYQSRQQFQSLEQKKFPSRVTQPRERLESWDFPGFGNAFVLRMPDELTQIREEGSLNGAVPGAAAAEEEEEEARAKKAQQHEKEHPQLGEWKATAICGNDILSSCLYVSGVVAGKAGVLSPLCLLLVTGVLYLMRGVYGEAITALPMNGGSYNLLINTASKAVASLAACLAIISYIATGVVSASSAAGYFGALYGGLDQDLVCVAILLVFALLMIFGISESANVALAMFILHNVTLAVVCVLGLGFAADNWHIFVGNWQAGFPDVNLAGKDIQGTLVTAMFFGFASSMLGVSGFESASQFVEEQAPGVFVKTLRNMWWGVFIFNPLISFLCLCALPVQEIAHNTDRILAVMAREVGLWIQLQTPGMGNIPVGRIMELFVSLDALFVLSGAVLTAYVGALGLIRRMAKDRVLPQVLLQTNEWRGTNHNIIVGYFLLCVSQVFLLQSNIESLAGVYAYAFVGLMLIFTLGTAILKVKRTRLPRDVVAPWWSVITAFFMILLGFLGTLLGKPQILSYFILYFCAVGVVILIMFQRVQVMRLLLRGGRNIIPRASSDWLRNRLKIMKDLPIVFFCKYDDLYQINKAILYVRNNEQTNQLLVINVVDSDGVEPPYLAKNIENFDLMYPKLKISLLTVLGHFSPALIEWLSKELEIPKNMMFITCPDQHFKYKISALGGVRVITH